MFNRKKQRTTTSVFFHPSLKSTISNTFFILFAAFIGAVAYYGIDIGMSRIISLVFYIFS